MRFGALLRELVPKIHSGALGKILMLKAQRHHGDLPKGKVGEWYFEAKRSGDMIVEQAVHNLDVCNWVINARPERAAGFGGLNHFINDPPGRTTMDHYAVIYEYPGGVRLDFSHVYFHPGSAQPGSYFHIYGSQGMLDLMRATFHPLDRRETETWAEVKPNPAQGEPNIDAFYESIRANRKAAVDLETGAVAALTAILGREAIYTKKVVEWKSLGVQI